MEGGVKYELDYQQSIEMINRGCGVRNEIRTIMDHMFDEIHGKEIEVINELVLDAAKKMKTSVYEVCFHSVPRIVYEDQDMNLMAESPRFAVGCRIGLAPVEFNLTQGPGYWKGKYYRLKEQMQKLIDNKED